MYEAGVETGLLSSQKNTNRWKRITEQKESYSLIHTQDNVRSTHQDNLYTSADITSGMDLPPAIACENNGLWFANKIIRELLVYYRRSPGHTQKSIYLNYRIRVQANIHLVQDLPVENLQKGSTNERLAQLANRSVRNLTRAFKKATRITTKEYVKLLRPEKLNMLAQNTGLKEGGQG